MVGSCSCSYCKDYRSYSPTRHHDIPPPPAAGSKHHMDGASASSNGGGPPARLSSGSHTPPRTNGSSSVSPPPNLNAAHHRTPSSQQSMRRDEDCSQKLSNTEQTKTTTLKLKLPDLRKGGNKIQISLEVGDIVYEGVICASSPTSTLMNSDDLLVEEEPRESSGH